MKHRITIIIVIVVVVLSVQAFLNAQTTKSASILNADLQDMVGDSLIASGNVEITWDEYKIYADYMEYNQKTNVVIAQGRVTMASNNTVISGERLEFNLKERTGFLFDTYGQMSPTVRYKTNKLTQVNNETLTFDKIDFTTCTQCVPRWKISCRKGRLKKEKYIVMKDAVIKIKNIPVFYLPYIKYPLNANGRATGFLFPGIGRSTLRGFFLLNSFFWAIKPNVDLTLSFDYYSKAGIGASPELRYLFKNMDGNIKFYYFKYKSDIVLDADATAPKDSFYSRNKTDYFLKATHNQYIRFLNTRIVVDVDRQSGSNFKRLFSNDFYAELRRTAKSSVSLSSSLNNFKLSVMASQFDTYYTYDNSSTTLKYTPRVNFNWNQQKIWKLPGYFSLEIAYSAVQRQTTGASLDEEEGLFNSDSLKRFSINPSYSLSLFQSSWAMGKLTFDSKQSYYDRTYDPVAKKSVDEPIHVQYHTANFELKGPVFAKIYEFKNSKLKHLFEPGITMRYVTKVDDQDMARLLKLDRIDYPSYSYIGFSLKNTLLSKNKKDKSAQEVFSHTISQDYYFDPALGNFNRKINNIYPEFSELSNTLRFRPFSNFSVDASLNLNHYMKAETLLDHFSRINFSIAYTNPKSPVYGNFNFSRYIYPYAAEGYILNRDTIGGSLHFDPTRFPVKFDAIVNYDITAKEFRNANFKLTFDYQCLRFNSELRLLKFGTKVDTQFNFGVSLGNMGMVKDFLGIDK